MNIGMDTILFIDDQQFELDEVKNAHPEINCINAEEYLSLPDNPQLNPRFITSDAQRRRQMYIEDIHRKKEEIEFKGPSEKFLATLNMEFIISEACEEDLQRAEELTVRTNQLNATGITYSYEELDFFRKSNDHKLYICELVDKYGPYGKIGLALVSLSEKICHLKLLLMSCRVMSRGVGTVLLMYIINEALKNNKLLHADFINTDKNRMMYVTYKFAGFKEIEKLENGAVILENTNTSIQKYPDYLTVKII